MRPVYPTIAVVSLLIPLEMGAMRIQADEAPPEVIELTGVVRDFKERTVVGGHPDFERQPDGGFKHFCGNVAGSWVRMAGRSIRAKASTSGVNGRTPRLNPSAGRCMTRIWEIDVVGREVRIQAVSNPLIPSTSGIAMSPA